MYKIKLTKIAAEYIKTLDSKSQKQVIEKIELLKNNPMKVGKQVTYRRQSRRLDVNRSKRFIL